MEIDLSLHPGQFKESLDLFWKLAEEKVHLLEKSFDPHQGSPVFTVRGKYTSQGWTEWTQGFQFGIPLLIFSVTGDKALLDASRKNILKNMAHHLTHFGVHDHGFNTLSTYGQLLRCANTGLFRAPYEEKELYRMALKVSGAVQARRWTETTDGGYIYSFNGPHSLFIDTMRSCRILLSSYLLGHRLLTEHDEDVNLLERTIIHALTTAKYAVYYGQGRDAYDVRGRVAHESLFNTNDGRYRCPNSQQGYSAFSTWTRGLAWAMLGFSELVEFLATVKDEYLELESARNVCLEAAEASSDFYLENTAADGIPYWDTGAPQIQRLGNYRLQHANPYNPYEPVDSSAAAIAAQGLIRLGTYLKDHKPDLSVKYLAAGMGVLKSLLSDPYLSKDPSHQGILLHSVYHRPNGWDHIPDGQKIPCGESSMWGDYHMTELCYTVHRMAQGEYYTFFEGL